MNSTFESIINTALKTPQDADYGVRDKVHTLPIAEIGLPWAILLVEEQEKRAEKTGQLKPIKPNDNHIIMGFGGLAIFDLAVVSSPPPAGLLLCDVNSAQIMFWEAFLALVEESDTTKAFRNRFVVLSEQKTEMEFVTYSYEIKNMAKLEKYPSSEGKFEWMYNEDKYQQIRQMVKRGKVASLTLDALDSDRYACLKGTLENNSLFVSTLYLSNIDSFFENPNTPSDFYAREFQHSKKELSRIFWKNQLSLCNEKTLILDAREDNPRYEDQFIIREYSAEECRHKFLGKEMGI